MIISNSYTPSPIMTKSIDVKLCESHFQHALFTHFTHVTLSMKCMAHISHIWNIWFYLGNRMCSTLWVAWSTLNKEENKETCVTCVKRVKCTAQCISHISHIAHFQHNSRRIVSGSIRPVCISPYANGPCHIPIPCMENTLPISHNTYSNPPLPYPMSLPLGIYNCPIL